METANGNFRQWKKQNNLWLELWIRTNYFGVTSPESTRVF